MIFRLLDWQNLGLLLLNSKGLLGPTVDGSEIPKANHLEVFQTLGNNMKNGINYLSTQLVSRISEPSTVREHLRFAKVTFRGIIFPSNLRLIFVPPYSLGVRDLPGHQLVPPSRPPQKNGCFCVFCECI